VRVPGRLPDWIPVLILAAGAGLVQAGAAQRSMPLRRPLASVIPGQIAGYAGADREVSPGEAAVVGTTSYLMRMYRKETAATPFFTVYVGYYPSQAQGRTIHSPRNCLPGGGWEALSFAEEPVQTARGPIVVARYLIRRGDEQALVLYWYQGRGRVESGEYAVKYQLLRDAALRGRSEEALVRVMVPVTAGVESSAGLAREVAAIVAPALFGALPE
jgi:EpsI family protein